MDSGGTCYCTNKLYSAEFKPWDYIISKNFLVFFFSEGLTFWGISFLTEFGVSNLVGLDEVQS